MNNLQNFNNDDYEKLQNRFDALQETISKQCNTVIQPVNNENDNNNLKEIIEELKKTNKELLEKLNKQDNLEKQNKEILEKINSLQTKTTTGFTQPLVTLGPRLQKINPETLQLVKVYETVAEALKESNFLLKRPSLQKAILENTIYNGFRWSYRERDEDENVVNILPTKITKIQNIGYIAKLNQEKTKILNVYIDRKTAAIENGYLSSGALDTPVKNGTLANGNYYILLDKCDEELQNEFIEENGEPLLYKDGIGQFDNNKKIVKEFICKYDCIKQLKMSDKTLAKALDKDITYNGYYYKTLGSKTKWL